MTKMCRSVASADADTDMDACWRRLPRDLLHRVLVYDGRIHYRHGAYMGRLSPDHEGYRALYRLSRHPVFAYTNGFSEQRIITVISHMVFMTKVLPQSVMPTPYPFRVECSGLLDYYMYFYVDEYCYIYHRVRTWGWIWMVIRACIGEFCSTVVRFLQHI